MEPIGETTPMDRQRLCAAETKSGHVTGVPCGDTHKVEVHVFDTRMEVMRCFGNPNCKVKLPAIPRRQAGKHHKTFGDYVVVMGE